MRTPLSDLLLGARKADRVRFAAGGLAYAIFQGAHDEVFLLHGKARRIEEVEPECYFAAYLVNVNYYITWLPWP